jgi:glycosyltransferase involved in cell wall biosynthesis
MPAYQAAATVGAAVESVLWQTYEDLELLVIDDGSTDATCEIVAAHRGPVRLIRQENRGVAAARNAGLAAAAGELITLCDADDLLFPGHLAALVAGYERRGGIVTSNSYWLFPGGIHPSRTRYRGRFPPAGEQRLAILEQNFVSTMSLFPRRLPEEIGPFQEDLRFAEDLEFWIRAIYAGYRVSLQPVPLSLYRWGAAGMSAKTAEMDAGVRDVLRAVATRDDLLPAEREYLARVLAGPGPRELGRIGDEALRRGRYGEAARCFREAAALSPSLTMLVWKARLMSVAPSLAGPVLRARQLRLESRLGLDERHRR